MNSAAETRHIDGPILIVEDQNIVARDLQKKLQALGYRRVDIVSTGKAALAQVAAEQTALILMDIRLRGTMDGIETAGEIGAQFGVPVIYITGHADEETLQRAKRTAPYSYLTKPIERRALRSAVEVALYRHEIEQQLRESEQKFRAIFDLSPDAILLAQGDTGRIADANPAACRLFGRSRDELIGIHQTALHPPEESERARKTFTHRPLRGERDAPPVEMHIVRADGAQRMVEIRGRAIHLGGREYVIGAFRDVTERARAKQLLVESEQQHRLLAEHTQDIISRFDRQFRHLYANPAATRVTGLTPGEFIGKSHRELGFSPTQCDYWEGMIGRVFETGEPLRDEFEFQGATGPIVFDWQLLPEFGPDGRVETVLSSVRDITEQMRTRRALRESETRYRTLLEHAGVAIGYYDLEGRIVLMNEKACSNLKKPLDEIVGRPVGEVFGPEVGQMTIERIAAAISTGEEREYEDQIDLPTGKRWFTSIYTCMTDEKGRPTGVQIISHDISERVRAEQALEAHSEQLEQMVEARTRELQTAHEQLVRQEKLAVLGRLAGTVGHELRNPLGAISNAAYLLHMTVTEPDQVTAETLDMLSQEVARATHIVSDLLDFARTRAPTPQVVAVEALLRASLERHPAPSDVRLHLDLPADLPAVYVDPEQMEQVIDNLISNAYQAMPEGGALTVRGATNGAGVRVEFADTGCGISPAHMERLFEPLFTTKPRGIGLGLVTCKNLVEANEGTIAVESKVDVGTTIAIALSAAEA